MTFTPARAERRRLSALEAPPGRARRAAPARKWAGVAAAAGGLGLGASLALPLSETSWKELTAAGGGARLAGDLTAMSGTYLLLIMVLLAARLPGLERLFGQDRLIRSHRRLSSAPLILLSAHAVLTTLAYAEAGRLGFWAESRSLVTTMAWIFAALVSYLMLVGIAGISIRAARRKMSYDTWWVVHLYTYLALAFSVPHQIFDGTSFVGHHTAQSLWILLWLATAGTVVTYRLGLPLARSLYHRLEVAQVTMEGPGVYSLIVRGHHLDRLPVDGGQYFGWRFLKRGMWWHCHLFSLSAAPRPPYMRVTIKVTGDATAQIAALRPGTRVAIEGPYGAFTDRSRTRRKVALIGAGVGITPLRALLEDLPSEVDVVVVQRASTAADMIHRDELASMMAARKGRLVELIGSRHEHRLDRARDLHRVVPDISTRGLYVCGPDLFAAGVTAGARRLGVAAEAIHCESFHF